ncbi:unnamed protein product, partial [Discosporangium mesarthrocarpum]
TQVDYQLGVLRLLLTDLGQWDNTVLLFMSDNGGFLALGNRNYPFRGGKRDYWEGGVSLGGSVTRSRS